MKIPIYLKAFCSPFKRPKLKWYFGKTKVGLPYFLPRKWRKVTYEEAMEMAVVATKNERLSTFGKNPEDIVHKYVGYQKAVPLKFGFSYCGLGWKTKWGGYRFEYSPVWSFVAFGYQIALTFDAPEALHYWECFLPFYYDTDKKLSWKERIEDCKKRYPCVWTTYRDGGEGIKVDYYNLILKKKYEKLR